MKRFNLIKKYGSGTTIIEALIYMGLFGILFTGIYAAFFSSIQYFQIAMATSNLQQNAMSSLTAISKELCLSDSTKVIIGTNPPGIIFPSPLNSSGNFTYDTEGELYWNKWICYYLDTVEGKSVLIRKESLVAASTDPTVPTGINTTAKFQNSSAYARTVGFYASSITATGTNPLQLQLSFTNNEYRKTNQFTITSKIYMRN